MDRRIIFFLVFVITLTSTLLVTAVSLFTKQPAFDTVLYALATMWIMGIVTQLLLQNLYQAIVRPMEQARMQERAKEAESEVNLEEIEEIDQVTQMVNQQAADRQAAQQQGGDDEATVGVHVEQKG